MFGFLVRKKKQTLSKVYQREIYRGYWEERISNVHGILKARFRNIEPRGVLDVWEAIK